VISRPIRATDVVLDTATKLTASECKALKSAGVSGVWRYVFFGTPRPGDIDAAELQAILDAGLTLMLVQHVRMPGWIANAGIGKADGASAVRNAQAAGYEGTALSLGLDMEGVGTGDAAGHARAWCQIVGDAGYSPVVYVGYDSQLTGPQLDSLPYSPRFWCDYAPLSSRPLPTRGYALHQQAQSTLAGIGVDIDTVLQDMAIVGLCGGATVADTDPAPPDPHPDVTGEVA
jgi:hypothetical protein